MKRNYYQVTAKCGHVGGRKFFIEKDFYVCAENASDAAGRVRNTPRVKHHHKDAIIRVTLISQLAYQEGLEAMHADPYFNCYSKQDQNRYAEMLADQIQLEVEDDENASCKRKPDYAYRHRKEQERLLSLCA